MTLESLLIFSQFLHEFNSNFVTHSVLDRERLKMLLKIIIFQILLIVVCAEDKCHKIPHESQDSVKVHQNLKCDHDINVELEYRNISVDKPYSISFKCENRSSSFHDLLPFFNVSDLEAVERLDIAKCQLPQQYSMLESKFPKVVRLNLVNIRLTRHFFHKRTRIEEIEVSNVIVMNMDNLPLLKMPKLRKIDLHWCGSPILVLKKDALADIPHLTHVTIMYSKIKMLPDTLFRNSTNIQHIDFSYNAIEHVPNTLFTNLTKLQTIDFSNNIIASIDL